MSTLGDLKDWMREQVASRVPKADLDQRDPDYIRDQLPRTWLLASLYFRADVQHLERIPAEGPVLLVGNHSGGNVPPDTFVFTLAFCSYFGVERPFYQLAHDLVVSAPPLGWLRKFGTVAANPENATGYRSSLRRQSDRPRNSLPSRDGKQRVAVELSIRRQMQAIFDQPRSGDYVISVSRLRCPATPAGRRFVCLRFESEHRIVTGVAAQYAICGFLIDKVP